MILTNIVKKALGSNKAATQFATADDGGRKSVLNVGGGTKKIAIPPHYDEWHHYLLDIAAGDDVDLVLDARKLSTLEANQFDAIYCSHNLEHYDPRDGLTVLAGFLHVLKPDGYAEINVPDMTSVLRTMVERNLDIDDVLYMSNGGPITVHDVVYGWRAQMERSGVDFYAHRRGFTAQALRRTLDQAGFAHVVVDVSEPAFNIRALAFKGQPTSAQRATLDL